MDAQKLADANGMTLLEDGDFAIIKKEIMFEKIKVLVVEDIALNQLLMKTLLDDFGFDCEFAENGKVAIEKPS